MSQENSTSTNLVKPLKKPSPKSVKSSDAKKILFLGTSVAGVLWQEQHENPHIYHGTN
jgi:hypothetical protein